MTSYLIKSARILGGEPTDLLLERRRRSPRSASRPGRRRAPTVVDADGLVALPGLVDLHTHLREPGREDAETVETGTRAAALGGFTAVHAMANTDPVADTAGVVEQVWRLGREAGHCDVARSARSPSGSAASGSPSSARWPTRAARVRVFSDDGKCVSDAVLMRRALEYVKAFDGVIAQHAQEPRLTEDAQMNEGELSGRPRAARLAGGRRGGDHRPRLPARRARRLPAARLPRVHRRLGRDHPLGQEQGLERHRRGHARTTCCSPTSWPRRYDPIYKVNPPLRTAADVEALRAGLADGTIDVVATDHAPHPHEDKDCEWAAAAFGHARPGDRAVGRAADDGRHRPARLGRRRRPDVAHARPDRPARRPRPPARGRRAGQPGALRPVGLAGVVDAADSGVAVAQHAVRRSQLPGRVVATFLRGTPTVLDGKGC